MKLTSARKDYGIYGFMVAVFLAGTIAFFVRYGTSEIWYTLLMIAFLLLSLYFFSCTLRFRVMWDEEGIRIRQNWKPEKHYAWTELEQMYIEDQCIILYLDGKKYGFSQGCPNSMELIDFLEQKFPLNRRQNKGNDENDNTRANEPVRYGNIRTVSGGHRPRRRGILCG